MRNAVLLSLILLTFPTATHADEAFPGTTLLTPTASYNSYLIDMDGTVIKTWHGANRGGYIAYMFPDESIYRACSNPDGYFSIAGSQGHIQRIDTNDIVIWDYVYSTPAYKQHHDFQPMPNGNVLLIAWELKTDLEAFALGRVSMDGDEIWPLRIVEVEPDGATGGNILWEWHLWDHLIQDVDPGKPNYGVIADHPELFDINFGNISSFNGDWLHANSIDYNVELDRIVFSSRTTDEFYVIDHSTTTEEAAGHTGGNCGMGGDILYRWGNPQIYDRGDESDRKFHVIHGANWIYAGLPGEGNILAFNNGDRDGIANDWSAVYEISPPMDLDDNYIIDPVDPFGPADPTWSYDDSTDWYAGPTQCGAFRLPNGNTLICSTSTGWIFEVTQAGTIVWEHIEGVRVGRAPRYWYSTTDASSGEKATPPFKLLPIYPNPFNPQTKIEFTLTVESNVKLEILDVLGRRVATLADRTYKAGTYSVAWNGQNNAGGKAASGVYFVRVQAGDSFTETRKIILLK